MTRYKRDGIVPLENKSFAKSLLTDYNSVRRRDTPGTDHPTRLSARYPVERTSAGPK